MMDNNKPKLAPGLVVVFLGICIMLFCWQYYSHNYRWNVILEGNPSLTDYSKNWNRDPDEIAIVTFYKNTVWRFPALWYVVSMLGLKFIKKRKTVSNLTSVIYWFFMVLSIIGLFYSLYIGFDVYGLEGDY